MFRAVPTLFALVLSVAAFAGERGIDAARDAAATDGHGYLAPGSWIVTETRVRSDGAAVTEKRKLAIVPGAEGDYAVQESRWATDGFEPAGPARPLALRARQAFDRICPKPDGVQPDRVVTVGPKRYVCRVETYTLRDQAEGRVTTLTLLRDKTCGTQLPPRTISIHGAAIPLPADALQAEIATEGPGVSTKSRRVVSAIASPLRVNGQTITCLVETTETRGTEGGKDVQLGVREWSSHDVPGEPLRRVTCGTIGGTEVQSETTVIDFHVARPATPSGATAGGAGGMPTILPSAE